MNATPYLSSEDSTLLRKAIRGLSGRACLEIGAGNGGNLVAVSRDFQLAVGTDLVGPGMDDWSQAGANFLLSDLASCFRDETFDMVMFNPPYLSSEEIEDPAVDAGREGEVTLAFLREALRVVRGSGVVLMILSQGNPLESVRTECERRGFKLTRIESVRLFFEELTVYRACRAAGPD